MLDARGWGYRPGLVIQGSGTGRKLLLRRAATRNDDPELLLFEQAPLAPGEIGLANSESPAGGVLIGLLWVAAIALATCALRTFDFTFAPAGHRALRLETPVVNEAETVSENDVEPDSWGAPRLLAPLLRARSEQSRPLRSCAALVVALRYGAGRGQHLRNSLPAISTSTAPLELVAQELVMLLPLRAALSSPVSALAWHSR